jgi:hypothetical protein
MISELFWSDMSPVFEKDEINVAESNQAAYGAAHHDNNRSRIDPR